jgi:TPR repeat protein
MGQIGVELSSFADPTTNATASRVSVSSSLSTAPNLEVAKTFPDQKLLQRALAGNAAAQCQVGVVYATGAGIDLNFGVAREWYRKAADQGHAESLRHLGNLSRFGQEGHKDYPIALELYRKAAEHGDIDSLAFLCQMYEAGEGVPANSARAMDWYNRLRKLADQGNVRAEFFVGFFNYTGIAKKSEIIDPLVQPPTGNQDIEPPVVSVGGKVSVIITLTNAILDYALPKVDGLEVVNKSTATTMGLKNGAIYQSTVTTFTIVANRSGDFVIPAFDIPLVDGGVSHEHPLKLTVAGDAPELPPDFDTAFDWFTKAATAGDAEAAYNLSLAYTNPGKSTATQEMNAVYAKDWLHRSADEGNAEAECQLGANYAVGKGETVDFQQALLWDQKAAAQGNTDAEVNLGLLYANGRGVTRDTSQALSWVRKAINKGNIGAKYILGTMYDDGSAGIKDHALALKWYTEAAARGK